MPNKKNIPITQIENDVPIPTSRNGSRTSVLNTLEVGESFVFPILDRATVSTTASRLKRETGKGFVVRKKNDTQLRIWRVT